LSRLLSKGLTVLSVVVLTSNSIAQTQQLTVVGAGGVLQDAERKAFLEPFAKETNVSITEDSYSGQMAKVRAMVESKTVSWDVMQVEQNTMMSGCEEGLFERLDWKAIGERSDFIPEAYSDCGVGAFVWSMVLSYDRSGVADGPKNWAEFWDLKKWPGKRGLRQTAKMTLEIALLADGVEPKDIYKVLATKVGQDRAFAKLDQIKPSILWWTSGAEALERLASRDTVVAAAFNGRVTAGNKAGRNFALVWDGQVYGIDYWGIVRGSPHKQAAENFIKFASQPGPQTAFPNYIAYGVTNKKAIAAIDPKVAEGLPTTPENLAKSVGLNTAFWADNGEMLEARFATWRSQ
jgi:putative spermidine/putrescine transport system substrate-binding protein